MFLELPQRIRNKFFIEENGCWTWTGSLRGGYGRIYWNRTLRQADRIIYEFLHEKIPAGLELDHKCFNKACVNPNHVEPVTPQENARRSRFLRGPDIPKTHCKWGHEFTPENTRHSIRDGSPRRTCIECGKDRSLAARLGMTVAEFKNAY